MQCNSSQDTAPSSRSNSGISGMAWDGICCDWTWEVPVSPLTQAAASDV